MKNILVIADTDNKDQLALEKAMSLAPNALANIHVVLFYFEHLDFIISDEEKEKIKNIILDRKYQDWKVYLEKQNLNIKVTHETVWERHIDSWVEKYCGDTSCDLIIKTGNRSESSFHTPTDWQLFRSSKVPVYCVSRTNPKTEMRVLVALDMASKSEEKKALNVHLLEAAFKLALQTGSTLYCCSAIEIPILLKELSLIDMSGHKKSIEKEIEKNVRELFNDYDMGDENLFVDQGEPWKVITDYANEINAECIVIGSMDRKGISGRLIGNTAEKVIQHSQSDLLVISPE
jgi:universal stress protein E